jgi:cell division protein FtsZ
VIDPEMNDEIRVTVVATGLGQAVGFAEKPMKVVRRTPATAAAPAGKAREPNYTELEKPAVARKRAVGDGVTSNESLEELLDIPAFLRRQAD